MPASLNGSYPSSAFRAAKIVNEHLKACLDFNYNYTDPTPKPFLCHPIKESDIPLKNDSVIDAGFFVAPSSLNSSNANVCIATQFFNMYSCAGSEPERGPGLITELHYSNMDRLVYDDAGAADACLNYHHYKEGTDDFNFCMKMLS